MTPQLAVVRREEEEEALVQELLLEELLVQLLLPVSAPLAPSKRVRGPKKKDSFLCPRVIFLKLILSIEKLINILHINDRAY